METIWNTSLRTDILLRLATKTARSEPIWSWHKALCYVLCLILLQRNWSKTIRGGTTFRWMIWFHTMTAVSGHNLATHAELKALLRI